MSDSQHTVIENINAKVTAAPHIRDRRSSTSIMLDVIIALSPAMLLVMFDFGIAAAAIIVVSVASCMYFEFMYKALLKKPMHKGDLSPIITGILLAFCVPPTLPVWMVVVGAFVAIIVVKQLFGGLGQNFLNPALAAWAFLLAAYHGSMTDYTFGLYPDVTTMPTPLAIAAFVTEPTLSDIWGVLWGYGSTRGAIGETATILIILGGIYLLIRKVIKWYIPVSFIGSAALLIFIFGGGDGLFTGVPQYDIFVGAIILGAFFMATDYTTSPMTKWGQIIFGTGCGVITVIIRLWGGLPEGVAYAILLMNLLVPLIDKITTNTAKNKKRKERKYG